MKLAGIGPGATDRVALSRLRPVPRGRTARRAASMSPAVAPDRPLT